MSCKTGPPLIYINLLFDCESKMNRFLSEERERRREEGREGEGGERERQKLYSFIKFFVDVSSFKRVGL